MGTEVVWLGGSMTSEGTDIHSSGLVPKEVQSISILTGSSESWPL